MTRPTSCWSTRSPPTAGSCSRPRRWSPSGGPTAYRSGWMPPRPSGTSRSRSAADAVFATSRKWLTGPRGVGMLAVAAPHRDALRVRRAGEAPGLADGAHSRVGGGTRRGAGRAGCRGAGAPRARYRRGDRSASRRSVVSPARRWRTLSGWEVVHPEARPGRRPRWSPRAGQDVVRAQARLLEEHAILTSACLPWRAPREMTPGGPRVAAAAPEPARRPHRRTTSSGSAGRCGGLRGRLGGPAALVLSVLFARLVGQHTRTARNLAVAPHRPAVTPGGRSGPGGGG